MGLIFSGTIILVLIIILVILSLLNPSGSQIQKNTIVVTLFFVVLEILNITAIIYVNLK